MTCPLPELTAPQTAPITRPPRAGGLAWSSLSARTALARATLAGCAVLAGGCAATGPGGLASPPGQTEPSYFGVLARSSTAPGSPVVIQRTRGLGVKLNQGAALGWFDDWHLSVARDCRIVIVVPKNTDFTALEQRLQHLKELVCVSSLP